MAYPQDFPEVITFIRVCASTEDQSELLPCIIQREGGSVEVVIEPFLADKIRFFPFHAVFHGRGEQVFNILPVCSVFLIKALPRRVMQSCVEIQGWGELMHGMQLVMCLGIIVGLVIVELHMAFVIDIPSQIVVAA